MSKSSSSSDGWDTDKGNFLRSNQPWATCVSDGNSDLQELAAGQCYPLSGAAQLSVTPVRVTLRLCCDVPVLESYAGVCFWLHGYAGWMAQQGWEQ